MMAVVAVAPRKAGRQLPPWRELEVVQLENQDLMFFSRDPISTITVKLRAIALKETT